MFSGLRALSFDILFAESFKATTALLRVKERHFT